MSVQIDTKLAALLKELKKNCTRMGGAMFGDGQAGWFLNTKKDADGTLPGAFEEEGVHQRFDRTALESQYTKFKSDDKSTRQDTALTSNQSDMLASLERDYAARHRTRIRKMSNAALVHSFHGSDYGSIESGYLAYLQWQLRRFQTPKDST